MTIHMLRHVSLAALFSVAVLYAETASAQQLQKVSFKAPAENSKYALQQNVDVGDAANHIVRLYDVRRTYPTNPPVIGGLKVAESADRGIADYNGGNGNSTFYAVYTMENGDKFMVRASLVVQSASGKLTGMSSGVITGGTGKLSGIRGIYRGAVNFDPTTGFNEATVEFEYTVGN
jgi:hypothetical protein